MIQNNAAAELWKRLEQFSLDDATASFSFTSRLAKENNWRLAYADRVATEYKRFMLLAVICDHTVSPSDQVDQAWHLHMIYTRSYWDELCGGILGRPIHHGPTKGGKLKAISSANFTSEQKSLTAQSLASSHRKIFGRPRKSGSAKISTSNASTAATSG